MTGHGPAPKRRVLVVEDDFNVAEATAYLLMQEGIEVLGPVPTVQAALNLLAVTERIDGAVVDVNLRGELAYPVADVLRRRGIPCVFTTGYDSSSIARRAPGVPCLEKPLRPDQLLDALFGPRGGARPGSI